MVVLAYCFRSTCTRLRGFALGWIALLLLGCSIPTSGIKPDGTLTIYMYSPDRFRVGTSYFTESTLEVALKRLKRASGVREIEAFIPSALLGSDKLSCQPVRSWYFSVKERFHWRFFEWTPGDEASKRELACDIPVLAAIGSHAIHPGLAMAPESLDRKRSH